MFATFSNRAFLAIFGFGVFKYTAIGLYSALIAAMSLRTLR